MLQCCAAYDLCMRPASTSVICRSCNTTVIFVHYIGGLQYTLHMSLFYIAIFYNIHSGIYKLGLSFCTFLMVIIEIKLIRNIGRYKESFNRRVIIAHLV